MKRLHIVGGKNHGKTTLIVELLACLRERGLRVGTIKHTHHRHELDTPGKDSHRHRVAGAAVVGVLSPGLAAVFVPTEQQTDELRLLAPLFTDCDLVLVEGGARQDAPKIEVWRAELGPPLFAADPATRAIVSDDPFEGTIPLLPRSDVAKVADWILEVFS